jgi:hypothetical protein
MSGKVHLGYTHTEASLCGLSIHDTSDRVLLHDDIFDLVIYLRPDYRATYAVDRFAWCGHCLHRTMDRATTAPIMCIDTDCTPTTPCRLCNHLDLCVTGADF